MRSDPPSVEGSIPDRSTIESLVRARWGRSPVELVRLPGENLNLLARFGGGEQAVVKVSTDRDVRSELEQAVVDVLDAAGLPVPTTIAAEDGGTVVPSTLEGAPATVRMQRLLPGAGWRDRPTSPALARRIGGVVAEVHAALRGFHHPLADRSHGWDVATADDHRRSIELVRDPARRRAVESILQEHVAIVRSGLASCPGGCLHGDLNDENILVDGETVVGIVDFGDVLRGSLVQDLGITLAYAIQHGTAPNLELAAQVLAGYEASRRLEPVEREILFPLVRSRLASSALVGVARRVEDDAHSTWFSHEETTWRAIEGLASMSPAEGARALGMGDDRGPSVDALVSRRRAVAGSNLSISYESPLHIVRGRGQYLHDSEGRPFLDLVNNVCHVGHCHPRVVEAAGRQAARLNTNTRYLHESFLDYADRLAARLPDPIDTVFLVNSGSEANELALRLARAATGARDVLVIDGAYHGNTGRCVDMSPYKFDGPGGSGRPDWVHVAPSPDRYRGLVRGDGDDVGAAYALELATVVGEACAAGRSIAGFFAEPILSCGGQVPLPRGYLGAAFDHVRRAGGICIADEVQVGFGRVGDAFWGFELDAADGLEPVVPDIVVMGKPIGNGHPMGAVATTRAIADAFANGMEFFSTFGGNPVSCEIGMAVLDVIEDEGLQERARSTGTRLLEGLRRLEDSHEIVGDVRGRGLFLGFELVRDRTTLEPADAEATALVNAMRDRGVLLSTDGPLHNVIKIKPPLVVDEGDVDMTLRLLDDVLAGLG